MSSGSGDLDTPGFQIPGFDEQVAEDGVRYSKVLQMVDGDWEEFWIREPAEADPLPVQARTSCEGWR